mmetsp:Transcript_176708/g.566669  ORF Transcript_176708/g.566669 Transcript_176708/m.566669 type:complete len:214 (-) Transcript_176708:6365-7006(-)
MTTGQPQLLDRLEQGGKQCRSRSDDGSATPRVCSLSFLFFVIGAAHDQGDRHRTQELTHWLHAVQHGVTRARARCVRTGHGARPGTAAVVMLLGLCYDSAKVLPLLLVFLTVMLLLLVAPYGLQVLEQTVSRKLAHITSMTQHQDHQDLPNVRQTQSLHTIRPTFRDDPGQERSDKFIGNLAVHCAEPATGHPDKQPRRADKAMVACRENCEY